MIRCNSPFAYMDRCVIDMDSQQSQGGTICCDMAEDMDFDRGCILKSCEHAEDLEVNENELKPCPFCGGEAETHEERTDNGGVEVYYREYHSYIVRCKKCGASIVNCWGGMEQIIKQWNNRV